MSNAIRIVAVLVVAAVFAPAVRAEEAPNDWLAAVEAETAAKMAAATPAEAAPAGWEKPGLLKALSVSVDYTVVSDYIWRGLNFSEYAGEGREKLNHQLGVGFEIDPAAIGGPAIGRFGGSVWFEWFGGQEALTPWSDNNLQEVDYTLYWGYDIEAIGLGVEIGWIAYHFPRLRDGGSNTASDFSYTHEVYLSLSYDDSRIFGQPLLNPSLTYYQDVDDVQAGILALGVSHDFALAECCPDMPLVKDITVTPSFTAVYDHRFYDKAGVGSDRANGSVGSRMGFLEYGLAVGYDLSSALCIPEQFGGITLTGFLNFCQSLHDESAAAQDELYGGFTLGWDW